MPPTRSSPRSPRVGERPRQFHAGAAEGSGGFGAEEGAIVRPQHLVGTALKLGDQVEDPRANLPAKRRLRPAIASKFA
jgi:hypothetical protein